MRDPISKTKAYYLRTARSRYVKRLKTQRQKREKIIVHCHRDEDAIENETQKKTTNMKKYSFKLKLL